MIVQEPKTNTDAPLLGKEGSTMLELWKAQMEWLSSTGQLVPWPPKQDTEDHPQPPPHP
jgi:hypothetical protein